MFKLNKLKASLAGLASLVGFGAPVAASTNAVHQNPINQNTGSKQQSTQVSNAAQLPVISIGKMPSNINSRGQYTGSWQRGKNRSQRQRISSGFSSMNR